MDRDWSRVSGLPLEDVWFQSGDGTPLFGWYVEPTPSRAVLLWCHGNAGNIIHRLENLAELYRVGLAVFLFDYRGYGRSKGSPSEDGLYMDAMAAHAYLTGTRGIAPKRLVIFGRSLGAAVAGELTSRRPTAGLILENAFPSIEAMAKVHSMGLPARLLLQSRYPLVARLKDIHVPILVIHGDQDEIVPFELGKQVFEAAPEPKSFYVVEGAHHNDLYQVGGKPYFQRLRRFVEDVT
jgi:fermentation-respiration switch protein FrsA (DUF1100 family)